MKRRLIFGLVAAVLIGNLLIGARVYFNSAQDKGTALAQRMNIVANTNSHYLPRVL